MRREKAQAAQTARPKVPMRRLGADCSVVVMKRGNARGAKGAGYRHWPGSTGNGRNPMSNGRRQPSRDGTSRMTRECQVRICEGLGVKFPGPTRHPRRFRPLRGRSGPTSIAAVETVRQAGRPLDRELHVEWRRRALAQSLRRRRSRTEHAPPTGLAGQRHRAREAATAATAPAGSLRTTPRKWERATRRDHPGRGLRIGCPAPRPGPAVRSGEDRPRGAKNRPVLLMFRGCRVRD
jgi:hypothetical protein